MSAMHSSNVVKAFAIVSSARRTHALAGLARRGGHAVDYRPFVDVRTICAQCCCYTLDLAANLFAWSASRAASLCGASRVAPGSGCAAARLRARVRGHFALLTRRRRYAGALREHRQALRFVLREVRERRVQVFPLAFEHFAMRGDRVE